MSTSNASHLTLRLLQASHAGKRVSRSLSFEALPSLSCFLSTALFGDGRDELATAEMASAPDIEPLAGPTLPPLAEPVRGDVMVAVSSVECVVDSPGRTADAISPADMVSIV